jgi:hypothetical protein
MVIQVADDTASGVHRLHRFRQSLRDQEPVGAVEFLPVQERVQGLTHG